MWPLLTMSPRHIISVISPHSGGDHGWPQPVLQGLVSVVVAPDKAIRLASAAVLLPLI